MVRFHTKDTWRVEGILEDNVYPVPAQKKPWYLDKGRRRPVLRVTRKQFPLAPAFATTAHAAQGQTCPEGVVADLQIGEAGDPLTVYIAITRVRDRQGLFIYRPFDAAPFQRGAKLGRDLLLRFWRGDTMDWAALRAKYREERQCAERKEQKPASGYTLGRWKRMDAARICKECLQCHGAMMQPWQCMACYMWKQEDAFVAKYRRDEAECARWIPSMLGLHEPGPWARNAPARHDAKGERMFCSAGPRDPVQKPGKPTAKASTGHGGKSRGPPGRHACQSIEQRKHERIIAEVLAEIKRKRAGPEQAREEPVRKRGKLPEGLDGQGSMTLASQGTKTCQYIRPHCKATVESTIANGQVGHRAVCGSQFYVSDGKVQAKKQHEYTCPLRGPGHKQCYDGTN